MAKLGEGMTEKSPKKKILLIEDENILAEVTKEYFSLVAPEFEFEIALTLAEAREKLKQSHDWTLCICDYRLPDGKLCELLKEEIFPCPVIITSGDISDELQECTRRNKAYILRKPYQPADLYQKIREILES